MDAAENVPLERPRRSKDPENAPKLTAALRRGLSIFGDEVNDDDEIVSTGSQRSGR